MDRRNRRLGVFSAVVVAVLAGAAGASGQPAPKGGGAAPAATSDPAADVKKRFESGLAAASSKNWKKAAEEFGKAYELKPMPQIAGNLGEAELNLGRYRDAAEHLEKFLREDAGASPAEKEVAKGWLDQAKKKIVTFEITVAVPGADVLVDGKVVGKSPLPMKEVYVDPGKHTVEARAGEATDEKTDTYEASWTRVIKLLPMGPALPAASASGASSGGLGPALPPEPASSARTATLIATGALAVVGIGLGITGFAVSDAKKNERDDFCENQVEDDCLTPRSVDQELYDTQKATWVGLDNDRRNFFGMGVAGLVVGGIALAGTAATYFLWKPASSKPGEKQSVVVVPVGTGIVVRGEW